MTEDERQRRIKHIDNRIKHIDSQIHIIDSVFIFCGVLMLAFFVVVVFL